VTLDASLLAAKSAARPGERLPVLIRMRERPDLGALKREVAGLAADERRQRVVETLRAAAGRTQAGVLAELFAAQRDGIASAIRPLWSANAVAARLAPAELDRLAVRGDIGVGGPRSRTPYAPGRRAGAAARGPARRAVAGPAVPEARRASGPAAATAPTPVWSVTWIGAPTVWAQGYRGACVLVAIIDTGIDWNHIDLANRIWVNAGEIPGNGIDDDGNGFVDDVHGYDIRKQRRHAARRPRARDPRQRLGRGRRHRRHAHRCRPEARLMAVKVLSASGSGSDANIIAGIEYALANGAQVLNMSLGELCPSPATRAMYRNTADAVAAAGVTFCVAAGNDRSLQRPPT